MNFLTHEERAQLKAQHKRERDKKVCDRIKAVLLYDKGWSFSEIAEALLLSEEAVRHHFNEYKAWNKLQPESGGSEEKLSAEQSKDLEEHLKSHTYLYVKDIVAHVSSKYNVSYSVAGMRNWLQRHAFSYKKPAVVPGKANQEQQKLWLGAYERLKQNLPSYETICFMDGGHPTHNVQTAYGWIKKGERKEIRANSGRSRLNLSGLIDILMHKVIVQEDKRLNAESIIRNKAVTEYLKNSKIELHFLPPYSPNLNPIERLWKWMKERVVYNTYYEHFDDFKQAIMNFFSTLSDINPESSLGECFRNRVRDKFSVIGT